MRRATTILLPALAASLTLAACGGSGYGGSSSRGVPATSSSPTTGAGVIRTAPSASLGSTVLTDSNGMTLYSLSAEQNGKFICTSAPCTQIWHALAAPAASPPTGTVSLGVITRPDGTRQVTYKGLPLYTFAQDRRPGEAKGQGFKDVGTWTAATVASAAGAPASGSSTGSTSTSAPRSGY